MSRMKYRDIPSFAEYIIDAIDNDYYLTMLVTSYTQGKNKSMNLPFGVGKSTLTWWLSYIIEGGTFEDPLNMKIWDRVFDHASYFPYEVLEKLDPSKEGRLMSGVWDDVQATAGKTQHVPEAVRKIAQYMTTTRNRIACLIMNAPNMNSIAKPLADIVIFELIVSERGKYEVQKITYYKNWNRPKDDFMREIYIEEGEFPSLPNEVMERYEEWRRQKQVIYYNNYLKPMMAKISPNLENIEGIELSGRVAKWGGNYIVQLPRELGEELFKRNKTVKVIV